MIRFDTNGELLAVLRIREIGDAYKVTAKILKELRLTSCYSVVFMRKTPELMRKLILVEPYVAWGRPNLTTIQELLSKHAFTIVGWKYSKVGVMSRLRASEWLCPTTRWWKTTSVIRISFAWPICSTKSRLWDLLLTM